ncbi:transcriptional regulator [Nitrosopumilus sp.]|uniref:transcriptional regulator n=1 Tax=Nitrosopumilus sp. TaxID=2024843 RepID=UPI0034A069FB
MTEARNNNMKVLPQEIMIGVDQIFATTLKEIIVKNLGNTTIQKIQDRLFEKFGISITTAMEEFEKMDYVLREFFGAGAEGLEKKFLDNICSIKSKKDQIEKRFTISDPSMSQSILKAFSDDEMSKILNASIGEPWTISEILEKLKIQETPGYEKINFLIENKLLVQVGTYENESGENIAKYKSLFDNVNINFGNKITINVQFTQEVARNSSILQTVYGK